MAFVTPAMEHWLERDSCPENSKTNSVWECVTDYNDVLSASLNKTFLSFLQITMSDNVFVLLGIVTDQQLQQSECNTGLLVKHNVINRTALYTRADN